MPRIPAIFSITGTVGTVGGVTICRASRNKRNQAYLRARRRPTGEQFYTAASLAPLRHNSTDFAQASCLGKELRAALRPQLPTVAINRVSSRLTGQLRRLIGLETIQPAGQRRLLAAHLAGLAGFSFTPLAHQSLHLGAPCTVARTPTGGLTLTLPPLPLPTARRRPAGTTHVGYHLAVALFDETTGTIHPLRPTTLPAPHPLASPTPELAPQTYQLLPSTPASPTGPAALIIALGLTYFEQRDGQLVALPTPAAPVVVADVCPLPPGRQQPRPRRQPRAIHSPASLRWRQPAPAPAYQFTAKPQLPQRLRPRHQPAGPPVARSKSPPPITSHSPLKPSGPHQPRSYRPPQH